MRFVLAAAAAALFATPAMATVYTVSATINLTGNDRIDSVERSASLDQQLNDLLAGDRVDLTINFSKPLTYTRSPSRPIPGFIAAGLNLPVNNGLTNPGLVTFELGGATGDLISSGTAITAGPIYQAAGFPALQIADPTTFTGGSFTSVMIHYQITADIHAAAIGEPIQNATFVSSIPEPATWAMMIVGFGAIGGLTRARRSRQSQIATGQGGRRAAAAS